MNNNEMTILPHTVALPIVQRADDLAVRYVDAEIHSAEMLSRIVSMVSDNAFELELRITRDGYSLAFPTHISTGEVLAAVNQAFDVESEALAEQY